MASSSTLLWEQLLHRHDEIHLHIIHRLQQVDDELTRLDALRGSLSEALQSGGPVRRTVVLPPLSDTRKRCREESSSVAFLKVHHAERLAPAGRATDPFEDAGLYAEEGNPLAQHTSLGLSCDAAVREDVLHMFPPNAAAGMRKSATLPPAAVSRIKDRLREADLLKKKTSYVFGRRTKSGAYLRITVDPHEDDVQRLFYNALGSPSIQMLPTLFCSDPNAVGSSLYAAMAERAAVESLTTSARTSAVRLLGLEHLAHSAAGIVAWTFTACCQCADRDVMESTLVQWVHALRCARPRHQPSSPQKQTVLFAALCYTLLQRLTAASMARQGYLAYVLTACGNYERLVDVHVLQSLRGITDLSANVTHVLEGKFYLHR